jgi:hypothetical protein
MVIDGPQHPSPIKYFIRIQPIDIQKLFVHHDVRNTNGIARNDPYLQIYEYIYGLFLQYLSAITPP